MRHFSRFTAFAGLVTVLLLLPASALAQGHHLEPAKEKPLMVLHHPPSVVRKTTSREVELPFERLILPNGLTVLLSPDPSTHEIVVDLSFHAGTIYEPPGKGGLAHLTEHLAQAGPDRASGYDDLLELRGGRAVNAFTTSDLMTFRAVMPPGELGFALWANADWMGTLAARITPEEVVRHRRIVESERILRLADAPYGALSTEVSRRMFPAPHPLHGTILGTPAELASVTADELRAFAQTHLVPANAILTLVGDFDFAAVRAQLDATLGRLPPGQRAALPTTSTRPPAYDGRFKVREAISRRPRTQLAWNLPTLPLDEANALELGALLLRVYTSGAFGMSVHAEFSRYDGGSLFLVDMIKDREERPLESLDATEALLRYLTRTPMPDEVIDATFLAFDLYTLDQLDSPTGRAAMMTMLETTQHTPEEAAHYTERHWALDGPAIQRIARAYLERPRLTLHATPVRPLPKRMPLLSDRSAEDLDE